MSKALLTALTSCALVSACGSGPSPSAQMEAQARVALDRLLNDSASARFRDLADVASTQNKAKRMICGLVNAKNQFGAYAGWHRSMAEQGSDFAIVSVDADDDSPRQAKAMQAAFEVTYPAACPASGYSPTGDVAGAIDAIRKSRSK